MSDTPQPPQSIETEQDVLGCLLKDPLAFDKIALHLTNPLQFYVPKHQIIFRAMKNLAEAQEPVDITTVSEELLKQGKLGEIVTRVYLVELVEGVISSHNIVAHADIIAKKASFRSQIVMYSEAIHQCYQQAEEPSAVLATVSQKIAANPTRADGRAFRQLKSYVVDVLERCEAIQNSERTLGVPYGYEVLDELTGGAQPGDLSIIAGRPSMGKTALLNCMAANQCQAGFKVGVFSAETRGQEYTLRTLCTQAKVDSIDIKKGKTSQEQWAQLTKAQTELHDWDYWIDDSPGIDIHELVAKASRLRREEKIDIIYVDYFQILRSGGYFKNKKEMLDDVLTSLKRLAQNLEIPVFVLSQLNRELERRKNKVPILSDLKDTGDTEQDADFVIGLYRPEFYATKAQQEQGKFKNLCEIHILKQRNGPVGTVDLFFNEVFTRFEDMPTNSELPF